MIKISIIYNTTSTFKFVPNKQVSFNKAVLWMSQAGGEDTNLDVYNANTDSSINHIIRIHADSGKISIDLNRLPFDSIYYKNFYMQFLDDKDNEVDRTVVFQISPKGKEALYGIVNKLTFEFNQLARFSGTTVRVFTRSLVAGRCPKCWDEELQQPISSACDCGSKQFTWVDILARKVKTQSKQEFDDTGANIREKTVFQTYARVDFIKGSFFADLGSKEIYEISDRNIASIGGVRTSTMFIGKLVQPNDVRVAGILDLLD